jgi:aryl-alcohol dehydrogenase-like predicted oxidoreductase
MGIRRIFGQTGILLSNITLGTMRFSAERIGSQDQAVSLLEYLYDQGINTYHTSHEYETHTFFCDAFKQFKKKAARDTTHIVKLASPHFEENDFTFATLEKNIDLQLQELNIEQIDIVQWLFRQKNNVDEIRPSSQNLLIN